MQEKREEKSKVKDSVKQNRKDKTRNRQWEKKALLVLSFASWKPASHQPVISI